MAKPLWKKAEKDFESFFSPLGKKAYVFRLTDTAAAKATSGKYAFVTAQPSDYMLVVEGKSFFAEVKSSSSKTSFPHSGIRKGQIAAARMIIAAGGTYLIFIKSEYWNKWFCVPASFFINSKNKSSKWKDLEEYQWTSV